MDTIGREVDLFGLVLLHEDTKETSLPSESSNRLALSGEQDKRAVMAIKLDAIQMLLIIGRPLFPYIRSSFGQKFCHWANNKPSIEIVCFYLFQNKIRQGSEHERVFYYYLTD